MIDSNNNLNVLKVNTQTVAGITITTGSWLNVADNLSNVKKNYGYINTNCECFFGYWFYWGIFRRIIRCMGCY